MHRWLEIASASVLQEPHLWAGSLLWVLEDLLSRLKPLDLELNDQRPSLLNGNKEGEEGAASLSLLLVSPHPSSSAMNHHLEIFHSGSWRGLSTPASFSFFTLFLGSFPVSFCFSTSMKWVFLRFPISFFDLIGLCMRYGEWDAATAPVFILQTSGALLIEPSSGFWNLNVSQCSRDQLTILGRRIG